MELISRRRFTLLALGAWVVFAPTAIFGHPGHDSPDGPAETPSFFLAGLSGSEPGEKAKCEISVEIQGDYRVITANGIADHATGAFPNAGNPNSIAPQSYHFKVPLHPAPAAAPVRLAMQPFGIAINGVVFDPGAAEWWNRDRSSGWQIEPLTSGMLLGMDENHAHVQPNGAYHYHAIPTGLLRRLTGGEPKMVLLGWAADGYPIYGPWDHGDAKQAAGALRKLTSSYRVKKGVRPSGPGGVYDGSYVADWEYVPGAGDLDECNGRFGPTPDNPAGEYHYLLTETWPFIPRQFHGTPDPSFERHRPPGGPGGFRGGHPPFPPPGGLGGPGFGPPPF